MKKYTTPNFEAVKLLTDDVMNASTPSPTFEGAQESGIGDSVSLSDWLN